MKKFLLVAIAVLGFTTNAVAQFCPSCIQNSAIAQNAQFNVTSGTVRGHLTVGSLNMDFLNVDSVTANLFIGSGTYLTDLNASQLLFGTLPANIVVGNYSNITGLGTITSGIWHGSILGSQYGGTGSNLLTSGIGSIPYFSSVGTMSVLAPTTAGYLLQTNGSSAPSYTGAPQVLGTNITAIPMSNLLTGQLPLGITVNDASISTVSAAKVVGNIPGNATNITGTLAVGQLGAGTLNTSNAASSVTASGVTPGIYGGPTLLPQLTVAYDGRITSISQSSFTLAAGSITSGALPIGVTIGATQITAGALSNSVVASSLNATGVNPGSYGFASQTSSITVRSDGRVSFANNVPIAINTNQINNGTLTAGVVVPAANIQAGSLAGNVIASSLTASGIAAGTYGTPTSALQITVGADGRLTSATQYSLPGISTTSVQSNVDNAWSATQTFFASVTIHANLSAQNFTATTLSGDGNNIFNLSPSNFAAGSLPPSVIASSIAANGVVSGTYGDSTHVSQVAVGVDGRITSASNVLISSVTPVCVAGAGSSSVVCSGTSNSSVGTNSVVSGGSNNISTGTNAVVGGGINNVADTYSIVAGGSSNTTLGADHATVGGGGQNVSTGSYSSVGGGFHNISTGFESTISGGGDNTASGIQSFVGGGDGNQAVDEDSVVSGGLNNHAHGIVCVISGGQLNTTSGEGSVVSGGELNYALGINSVVSGGTNNTANQIGGVVSGGQGNTSSGQYSVVSGGRSNAATLNYNVVSGGRNNTATGSNSVVSGGLNNASAGDYSLVGGGGLNSATFPYTTVSGGFMNSAIDDNATVSGGSTNTAFGLNSTIGGGFRNTSNGNYSFIGGGSVNTNAGYQGTIAGGTNNLIPSTGQGATIGGGGDNTAFGSDDTISGGSENIASGDLGGGGNSTISGGSSNETHASFSSVAGGFNNIANGIYGFAAAGLKNNANGLGSFAGGTLSSATHKGSFVWNDSSGYDTFVPYLSHGINTFNIQAHGGVFFDSTNGVTISSGSLSVPKSSVTASAFFGVGSAITSLTAANISSGVLGTGVIASSVAATGVTTGSFGTATSAPSFTVGVDGRLSSAGSNIITPAAASITAGVLGLNVIASSVAASGVVPATYGTATQTSQITIGVDGRITSAFNVAITSTCHSGSGVNSVQCQGLSNIASGVNSTVSGGTLNSATNSGATVAGGESNISNGSDSTLGGGSSNSETGQYNTIAGGHSNSVLSTKNSVGGGEGNIISGGSGDTVSGGVSNTVTGSGGSIGGGNANTSAGMSTVGGGQSNSATGTFATVPGGFSNIASGDYSFAAGYHAQATNMGSFVWSDSTVSSYPSHGDNTFNVHSNGGIFFDSTSGVTITSSSLSVPSSSVTASAFFGDGSHLTNIVASSATPAGPAGGNLSGTYPNPIIGFQVIVATHIANGVITNTQMAAGTFSSISIPAANVNSGILGSSVIASSVAASGVVVATYGSATQTSQVTIGVDGRVTSASNVTITGVPAASVPASGVTAGSLATSVTISTANILPGFNAANNLVKLDGAGAYPAASGAAITSLTASNISAGTLGASVIASSVAATAVTAGSYGSATQVPTYTVGVDGRLTAASNTSIQIAESQVTNLTADLNSKASTGTNSTITSLTGLTSITSAYTATSSATNTSSGGLLVVSSVTAGAFFGDGSHLTGLLSTASANATYVLKSGDTMTGQLTLSGSTLTVGGNAFSVGISTFVVLGGKVGVGTSNPSTDLDVIQTGNVTGIRIEHFSTDNIGSALIGDKSRGTSLSSSTVSNGDRLMTVGGKGYDGSVMPSSSTANIEFQAQETFNSTSHGTGIIFNTTPVGSTIRSQGMSLIGGSLQISSTVTIQGSAFSVGNSSFVVSGGSVSIGSSSVDPLHTIDLEGNMDASSYIQAGSSMTATAFFGDASHLTNYTIITSSYAFGGVSIASTLFVGVATNTVTLRGGRPLTVRASTNLINNSAAIRTYTCQIVQNGVLLDNTRLAGIASTTNDEIMYLESLVTSSPSGSTTYSLWCESSSATGAQTANSTQIIVSEF